MAGHDAQREGVPSFERSLRRLRRRLRAPLPGRSAMQPVAPSERSFQSIEDARRAGCREGGALVLLYPHDDRAHTVLTVRSLQLRQHAGQVSFPGGARDPGEDIVACALREAWEELGIEREAVHVLGQLTPLYIPPSRFCLFPVLGAVATRPTFQPHPPEVAGLLEAPVDHFVGPRNRAVALEQRAGRPREVPYFPLEGFKVWGATAMVLGELAVLWNEANDGRH